MESPQLVRYSYLFEKKPNSRVFAPLADCYRKLGMFEEAFNILRTGIKTNPEYTLGYIVLSKAHRDLGEFHKAYEVIKMASRIDADNFSYKELRADLAYKLGEVKDALKLYCELDELNPNNDYSSRIKDLESQIRMSEHKPQFATYKKSSLDNEQHRDDWVQMNFSETKVSKIEPKSSVQVLVNTDEAKADDLVSHTLLNLYYQQENYSKALRVANTLLEQDPDNHEVALIRDNIVQARLFENEIQEFEEDDEISEDHISENKRVDLSGHDGGEKISELQEYLKKFQEKINLKSAQVQLSRHV